MTQPSEQLSQWQLQAGSWISAGPGNPTKPRPAPASAPADASAAPLGRTAPRHLWP